MIYLITTIRMSTAAVTVMKMMIAELFLASSSSSSSASSSSTFDVMTVLNPQAGGLLVSPLSAVVRQLAPRAWCPLQCLLAKAVGVLSPGVGRSEECAQGFAPQSHIHSGLNQQDLVSSDVFLAHSDQYADVRWWFLSLQADFCFCSLQLRGLLVFLVSRVFAMRTCEFETAHVQVKRFLKEEEGRKKKKDEKRKNERKKEGRKAKKT